MPIILGVAASPYRDIGGSKYENWAQHKWNPASGASAPLNRSTIVGEFVLVEVCWPEENFDQPWNAWRQRVTMISPGLMRDGNCREW